MAQWLDPVEQRAWNAIVALLNRLPSALDTKLQRDSGVTHFEFVVMTVLSHQPGHRQQMSELAATVNSSLSRLSHVVSKLERLGLVKRETTQGRRGVQAVLTDEGYLTTNSATPGYIATVSQLVFSALDVEQKKALAEIAVKVRDRIENELGGPDEDAAAE
ncbi:MAG TPA: MarR family winged helix-turn-helix transcriptional regulator [Nocardia sp.]|uniref:MarR family winged helix-turn-helix transcriptional regulator n=1 Tax=Nocardia TaxID=1817 RepID=UPI002454ABC1|nr:MULTISPECIES: MarR family winged helix-turn-helix transcriptional regulator [Nocardia]HLS78833.1 MarR family winged helix-turn-helix transcriptional regulator [Nocardia sp.]